MTRAFTTTAAALAAALAIAQPGLADGRDQLASAAGLDPSEAASLSLTELHALKINREAPRDGQITVSGRSAPVAVTASHRQLVAAAGIDQSEAGGVTLSEVAVLRNNRGATRDERIAIVPAADTAFVPAEHPQLLAAAGLNAEQAAGLSLNDIALLKYRRDPAN